MALLSLAIAAGQRVKLDAEDGFCDELGVDWMQNTSCIDGISYAKLFAESCHTPIIPRCLPLPCVLPRARAQPSLDRDGVTIATVHNPTLRSAGPGAIRRCPA